MKRPDELLRYAHLAAFFLSPDPSARQHRRRHHDEEATLVRLLAYSRMWMATGAAILTATALTLLVDLLSGAARNVPPVLQLLLVLPPPCTFFVLLLCGLGREAAQPRFRKPANLRRMSMAGWAAAGLAAVVVQQYWPL